MGAVQVETYNVRLMNLSDYRDRKMLENLLRNYHSLYQLGEMGDSVALSIFFDLEDALKYLPTMQRICVKEHFLYRERKVHIASSWGLDESTVRANIKGGLKNLQGILMDGTLAVRYGYRGPEREGAER